MHTTNTRPFYNRFLFIVSRHEWGHRSRFTVLIQRHIDHVAAGNMPYFSGYHIFRHNLDSNLHARPSHIGHFTMDRNDISNKSGSQKIKSLHPGRDHSGVLAVLDGDNGGCLIYHAHNHTTMHVAMRVCIYQFHESPGGASRVGNTSSLRQIHFRQSFISLCYSLERVHSALLTPTSYSLKTILNYATELIFEYNIEYR